MNPRIDTTKFGSITIDGKKLKHDVVIGLDGYVGKRRKKLSKAVYGTSHVISLAEAEHVYEAGAQRLIIGAGQHGLVTLSDDAAEFFQQAGCQVDVVPMPAAIEVWNLAEGAVIGLFHVTC